MKKIWISVLELAGIKYDAAAIEATDKLLISEEILSDIKTSLETAKGFQAQVELSNSDAAAAKAAEKTATDALSLSTVELSKANSTIEELQKEVARLGLISGGTKTNSKKEGEDVTITGLPSYCDQSLEIYQHLAEISK
jgi:hypothetical protein